MNLQIFMVLVHFTSISSLAITKVDPSVSFLVTWCQATGIVSKLCWKLYHQSQCTNAHTYDASES